MTTFRSPSPFPLHGRYAAGNKWEVLGGPGDARPTALQIIENEGLLLQPSSSLSTTAAGTSLPSASGLSDKVIFVTGASSGMGPFMVRALAATGATIYVGARDMDKARRAIGEDLVSSSDPTAAAATDSGDVGSRKEAGGLGDHDSSRRVYILHLDQTDLSSVRRCAAEFKAHVTTTRARATEKPQLNILINNAAVMRTPERLVTADGFELQLATNHLSHFLLFELLKDVLLDSATAEFPSRVVNSTSSGHKYSQLDLEDLQLEKEGAYTPWGAYGRSKVANIYMTSHITRLYGARNLYGFSAAPGSFRSPNLQQHCSPEEMHMMDTDPRLQVYFYNYEQACATAVYGAVAQEPLDVIRKRQDSGGKGEEESSTGLYLEGSAVAGPTPKDAETSLEYGHAEWAFDAKKEAELWEASQKLVGTA